MAIKPDLLVAAVKEYFPAATTIVLTGSALTRSSELVSDIDLLVLSNEVSEGEFVEQSLQVLEQPVDIVAYNSYHFLALSRNPDLILYNLRDIRKLLRGQMLLDTGVGADSVMHCRSVKPNIVRLQKILEKVLHCYSTFQADNFSPTFYILLEDLIFLKMHTHVDTIYSKHKYLLEDAKCLKSSVLANLLEITVSNLAESAEWPEVYTKYQAWLSRQSIHPPMITGILRDVKKLINANQMHAAVLPFRHVLVRTLINTQHVQIDDELSGIIDTSFAVSKPIPNVVIDLFDELLKEIKTDLDQLA